MTWQVKLAAIGIAITLISGLLVLVVVEAKRHGRQEVLLEIEIERNKNQTKADAAESRVEECYRKGGRWDRASQKCS